jgi:two-component system NarL family sensor kinase
LAGMRMQVSTSPYLLESGDVDAIRQLFGRLDDELARYTVQVRRLIEGLTPAPLEQLGLPGAVRRAAGVFERGTPPLTVDVISDGVPERPGQLAAAVEIAAYHISVEAIANAARHAQATNCQVRLTMAQPELVVEIFDDGHGLPPDLAGSDQNRPSAGDGAATGGVGLNSMRERAEELGGVLCVDATPFGGARVVARLPLAMK